MESELSDVERTCLRSYRSSKVEVRQQESGMLINTAWRKLPLGLGFHVWLLFPRCISYLDKQKPLT
jgi:hypothetical protein